MIQKRGSSWRESSGVKLPTSGVLYARYKWWTRSWKACRWHVVQTYGVYDCDEVKQRLWDADRQAGYARTNRQHNTDVRNICNAFSINTYYIHKSSRHFQGMEDWWMPTQAWQYHPQGKSSSGRLLKTMQNLICKPKLQIVYQVAEVLVVLIIMFIVMAVVVRKIRVWINERRYTVLMLETRSEAVTMETN